MKIFSNVSDLNQKIAQLSGKTIVFTNGVFDILHVGHIDLLEFSRGCGDCLIVGVNDDHSVKRLKGETRPVFPLAQRMKMLSAIMFVDFVIPFSEDTPLELIKGLNRVDVLVKGGDYRLEEVVGREEVEQRGGRVHLFDFKTNISTTEIIKAVNSR